MDLLLHNGELYSEFLRLCPGRTSFEFQRWACEQQREAKQAIGPIAWGILSKAAQHEALIRYLRAKREPVRIGEKTRMRLVREGG